MIMAQPETGDPTQPIEAVPTLTRVVNYIKDRWVMIFQLMGPAIVVSALLEGLVGPYLFKQSVEKATQLRADMQLFNDQQLGKQLDAPVGDLSGPIQIEAFWSSNLFELENILFSLFLFYLFICFQTALVGRYFNVYPVATPLYRYYMPHRNQLFFLGATLLQFILAGLPILFGFGIAMIGFPVLAAFIVLAAMLFGIIIYFRLFLMLPSAALGVWMSPLKAWRQSAVKGYLATLFTGMLFLLAISVCMLALTVVPLSRFMETFGSDSLLSSMSFHLLMGLWQGVLNYLSSAFFILLACHLFQHINRTDIHVGD